MHGLGQGITEVVFHDEGGAALAGLGIDADDGLILTAHVCRVDGQIGNLPHVRAGFLHVLNALVDGILMAAGESGEYKLTHIGLPGIDLHPGAALVHILDLVDVGEVQLRVNALGVHVHGKGHHVHVAGTLAVAEEGGFHALRAGQQTQLRRGNALATVIVGMERNDGAVPGGELADEILNAVSEVVGQHVFHRGGQVQDHRVLRGGMEMLNDGLTDLHCVVHFRTHKALRGILVAKIHAGGNDGLGKLVDQVGGIGGNFGNAVGVHLEDHLPLQGGGGVVEVKNDIFRTGNGLKGLLDQMGTGLHQHLNGDIIGNVVSLDELTADLILRL